MKTWNSNWKVENPDQSSSGGQGKVMQVQNLQTHQLGALKQIHPENSQKSERRQRFAREVLALQKVAHRGIPLVFEHNAECVDDKVAVLYLITDWIEGKTFQQKFGDKPVSLEEAVQITLELADILKACHKEGVLHRDIKPDNIIICSQKQQTFLIDFGLAWIDSEDTSQITHGQELGNRFLRVPDFSAGVEAHDHRTDVTFLVGMLFFLITGVAPRNLISSKGEMPHVDKADRIPQAIKSHSKWHLLQRIFRVGFQPSVDQRFQAVEAFIERLNELTIPEIHKENTDYQSDLQALREIVEDAAAKSKEEISEAMFRGSRSLMDKITRLFQENPVQVYMSGPGYRDEGATVFFRQYIQRKVSNELKAEVNHEIRMEEENRSYIIASYKIDGGDNVEYYRGPAADIERLEEEVLKQGEQIVSSLAISLREKIMVKD